MGLTAVHPERGRLDATAGDLGCAWSWEAIHRARPPADLRCPECGHGLQAKVSPRGLRFFAHLPGALACALAEESMAHHLLKLELATAARDAGGTADLEVSGPNRTWRADVLASARGRRLALEAQLAPITADGIRERTQRMAADGVSSVWFSDRPRPPWLGIVPSVRLAAAEGGLAVVEGLARFAHPTWWPQEPVPLTRFMDWLFSGQVLSHQPRAAMAGTARSLSTVWTTDAHIRAEKSYTDWKEDEKRKAAEKARLREEQRRLFAGLRASHERDEEQRRREEEQEREAENRRRWAREDARFTELAARADHTRLALVRHSARLPGIQRAIARLAQEHRVAVGIGWSVGDSRYACGVPLVSTDGTLLGVFDPLPAASGCAFLRDVGARLLFPAKDRRARFISLLRQDPPMLDYWTGVV
ncbi:competence protein CoiA family protein [Streptomyces sp. N2A]|uniref:competence protein CoiA n=1 Tax=Streptomyces sp. N2A TaxID=3073936 RepID=UPI0028708A28|nr:competence protein CoiA family protein [Streptomyces sp. N2A]